MKENGRAGKKGKIRGNRRTRRRIEKERRARIENPRDRARQENYSLSAFSIHPPRARREAERRNCLPFRARGRESDTREGDGHRK